MGQDLNSALEQLVHLNSQVYSGPLYTGYIAIWLLVLCGYCVGESGQKMSSTEIQGQSCDDTWFVPTGKNHTCKCGHTFDGIVSCDENTKQVGVIDCYCITFDSASNTTVVRECLFNCENVTKSFYDSIYHHVPWNLASGDDNSVCGYLNRQGRPLSSRRLLDVS